MMTRHSMTVSLLQTSILLVGFDLGQAFLSVLPNESIRPAAASFLPPDRNSHVRQPTAVLDGQWNREIDENSRRKAKGGMGETAAGAVLGGLMLGPFGALFGASIGSNFGARNAVDRARKEEMERLGLSQDMLDIAQDIGSALEKSTEGLQAVQNSLETQQRFAKRLDADVTDLYERAKVALANSEDALARKLLMERTDAQEKLKKALMNCAQEKDRLKKMQENISQLERRALEIDSLLRRNVSAKTIQDSTHLGLALSNEDPLLQKFKDMGID